MKVAIIDDELHCIKSLELHLKSLFPHCKIVYTTTKPKEAFDNLRKIETDILFLDVEMPGINGFELLEQFNDLPFNVIFTTAYSQYAVQAFKAKAINYLLKPIDESELKDAVESWQSKISKKKNTEEINQLLAHLKKEGLLESKIAIPVIDGYEFLDVNDILYCQSQNNYTYIYLKNGENILISKTLKTVEESLNQFYFIRTHQSYLVNPNFIKKYVRTDGGYLVMSDDKQIPVSSSKRELIVNIFEAVKRKKTLD